MTDKLMVQTKLGDADDDLLALTKFKNLKLWNLKGSKSWQQIGEESGAGYVSTLELLALKRSPLNHSTGTWSKPARLLAAYFSMEPSDLFPVELYKAMLPLQGRYVERALSTATMLSLAEARQQRLLPERTVGNSMQDVEDLVDNDALAKRVEKALATLTPREEIVIKARFGFEDEEQTLEEVGQVHGVSGNRIRQIGDTALRKLRHPSRSRTLRPFLQMTTYDAEPDEKKPPKKFSSSKRKHLAVEAIARRFPDVTLPFEKFIGRPSVQDYSNVDALRELYKMYLERMQRGTW